MKYKNVVMVLVVLMLCMAPVLAYDGQSTTAKMSLPHIFSQSTKTTSSDKIVLAVANKTDYGVIAIADSVSVHNKCPMLITSKNKLSPITLETLQQLIANDNVTKIIVVGIGNKTSSIISILSKMNVSGIKPEVYGVVSDTIQGLSLRASIYDYNNVSSAVICDPSLPRDISTGLMISIVDDIPLIYQGSNYSDINATLSLIGVKTVYTTPGVSGILENNLTNSGYTVNTSWNNKVLTESLIDLLPSVERNANATVIVDNYYDFIRCASVYGKNASILISDKDNLPVNVSTYLSTNKPYITIIMGGFDNISNNVAMAIASSTTNKVDRIFYDNYMEQVCRLGILEDNYVYPVIYAQYEHNKNTNIFKYYFKNIGFSNAVSYGDYALRVEFVKHSGEFVNCSVTPIFQNDTEVIFYFTNTLYPFRSDKLTFSVKPGTNFTTYPKISYNALTLAGAIINVKSYVDTFINTIKNTANWFMDMFKNYFGIVVSYIPLPGIEATIVASIILFLILWTIVGGIIYVIKVYVYKERINSKLMYGAIAWVLRGGR